MIQKYSKILLKKPARTATPRSPEKCINADYVKERSKKSNFRAKIWNKKKDNIIKDCSIFAFITSDESEI